MSDVLALVIFVFCMLVLIFAEDILDLITLWIERKGK
jgi:hypothetical protein